MSGPGRGLFRAAACSVFMLSLVGLLVFGVSAALADPPTFTPDPPPDVTTEATGPTTSVGFSMPVADDDGGTQTPDVACTPAPGSTFSVGTTPVSCTATDPT